MVGVDGVGFNFNRYFSSSVYVVVDTKLFDPILPMCDKSSCGLFCINGFQFQLSIIFIMEIISFRSAG